MSSIKLKELSKSLISKDDSIVIKAIKNIREEGKDELLTDLAKVYISTDSKEIREQIYALFCDLRIQSSLKMIIPMLKNDEYINIKTMLVSACWQTRLDFAEYLEVFIEMVIKEAFELSFEAFTVIENMETKVTPQRKDELVQFTNKLLLETLESNSDLANDILPIIERYEEI